MALRELYQQLILDHGRNPRCFGSLEEPCCSQHAHNPVCGDELTLTARVGSTIEDLKFSGQGCAISVASASLMCEQLRGADAANALKKIQHFLSLLTNSDAAADGLGKLEVFAGVKDYPARVKCATLAWHALEAILNNETNKLISTE